MPSQSRGPLVLRTIKDVLGLAVDALKGIGIPGVEAIPAIPLRIIAIFEVCVDTIRALLQLVNGSLQETNANAENCERLRGCIQTLHDSILRPFERAHDRPGFEVSSVLEKRIDRLNL
jgi:hypothetical protein